MNFINKLERKFGKYAISNLIAYVLGAYAIGYIVLLINPKLYMMLTLSPADICRGQVWRLFTWICTVPQEISIFLIFMFLFYYWIGRTLERYWGTFRYNLYMFSGYLFMTIGAMLMYFISGFISGWDLAINISMSTYYINLASFLAFATLFPDVQVYFMMILPIKIKWLAIVDGIYLAYQLFVYIGCLFNEEILSLALRTDMASTLVQGIYSSRDLRSAIWSCILSLVISVLNFLIFFLSTRNYRRISPKEIHRKKVYRQQTIRTQGITKHKCAICGRTEEDDENLVFRFCSKCKGNYEYCQEHLFTHEHRQ